MAMNTEMNMPASADIVIEELSPEFSICKVPDYSGIDMEQPFVFSGCTDLEKSLVCPIEMVPQNADHRDDGWKAFRICGELDFSLVGILAGITNVLASAGIGIFAVSTFNTDYVLVKKEKLKEALSSLAEAGYQIR